MPSESANQDLSRLILAIRTRGTADWLIETALSPFDEVDRILAERIKDNAEVRLVARLIHSPGEIFREQDVEVCALQRGWHRRGDFWIPIEVPLPLPPPHGIETAGVSFTVTEILFGSIVVDVTAGAQRVEFLFNDVYDNLIIFVRFIQILASGGRPHAAMADSTWCGFAVDDGPTPDLCRLIIHNDYPDRQGRIDIFTDRSLMIAAFRSLALQIGKHPNFAHHFLYHMCLPEDDYERVASSHDKEWTEAVQQGTRADDCDAENRLLGTRIVERVPLPPNCAEEADQYRKIMQSVETEIPRLWLLKSGLAAIASIDEISQILGRHAED